ncbi:MULTISPECIES: RNA polymerase sigma factor [Tenacibaculum]|uniref:RNA polymerase sigma factor n=1 Tax=Tenacibaculum TaxID=104267 RepID=UPI00089751EA|nr:RNA polymerase sigma factor [Tenacibaculum sp. MAR_2010_89]SEE40355.1 RNA polymerase sigma-70 factor, ECF subfamily [Tenacibaculum sp. MAR_2010_89]
MKPTKQLHQSIIEACKQNNAKAQMQLYDLYYEAMYTVALRYVKDSFEAEDIMQDAFIKAFRKIYLYKEEVAFGAWLKRIVINQSIDWLKKRKLTLVSINEEVTSIEENDDWNVGMNISYNDIVSSIDKLKEKYRVVLSLYLLEGYDHKEISQILEISEVTSRTHLMRGKKKVQEQLKNVYYG